MAANLTTLTDEQLDRIVRQQTFNLPYFRAMLRAVEQSFYTRLDIEKPILDLGSGDGQFAQVTFDGKRIFGFDPWTEPMAEAKARGAYTGLVQAVGDQLPVMDQSFPSIISNSVLEHIQGVEPVLKEAYRVLKPGGKFYFTVPNHRFRTSLFGQKVLSGIGLQQVSAKYEAFFNKIARHINLDAPEVWEARLQAAGFETIETWNYFPVWAMRKLERGHLWGVPNLLWKKVFGRWVLFPSAKNPFIPYKMVRNLVQDPIDPQGTCTFFIARRGL